MSPNKYLENRKNLKELSARIGPTTSQSCSKSLQKNGSLNSTGRPMVHTVKWDSRTVHTICETCHEENRPV